jgi:hypothetical protein
MPFINIVSLNGNRVLVHFPTLFYRSRYTNMALAY